MMKRQTLILIGSLFFAQVTLAQIYDKERVFEFTYSIENSKNAQKGIAYLACSETQGEEYLEGQYLIMWTTELKDFIYGSFKIGVGENTGVGEDKDSIYLHPMRQGVFGILEYSPFPIVYFPLKENKSWKWKVAIGEHWANKLKLSPQERNYKYEVTGVKSILLNKKFGKIDCYEIHATSINNKLKSSFLGLFNLDYGFVKMTYNNVDGSVIMFSLEDINTWKHYKEKAEKEQRNLFIKY
ncbi:MAG TPA: hypothetical protein PK784_12705 [Tenuifilaceae bacterium]|nr:hypothetical protein [Tenuifilaceae bacterium]HPN22216.1 hypothetical protein [Tenuifilaceae bacterium]